MVYFFIAGIILSGFVYHHHYVMMAGLFQLFYFLWDANEYIPRYMATYLYIRESRL